MYGESRAPRGACSSCSRMEDAHLSFISSGTSYLKGAGSSHLSIQLTNSVLVLYSHMPMTGMPRNAKTSKGPVGCGTA